MNAAAVCIREGIRNVGSLLRIGSQHGVRQWDRTERPCRTPWDQTGRPQWRGRWSDRGGWLWGAVQPGRTQVSLDRADQATFAAMAHRAPWWGPTGPWPGPVQRL
ncbi:hypothetical protein NDU88_004376 [Pleurodeles waltl]|uniref:Uncharacterized protein n=1 Tax=Pleurodeles waltl TaxID=8319 RepID=A0AAV7UGY5_PLEWA|nr:hypothetical protein NDU88_004376 [Pleurodeles waltl]